ncbi:MAG: RAD55 family ATPase, partial [Halobacteriaceae archaeon]
MRRIKTYINGLDSNIQGGIPAGHVSLISGEAGTMKSSVCFNILYNEALHGTNGLYISLEQSHTSIIKHMRNLGLDLDAINFIVVDDLATLAS